ncbi:hypothetical protein, partial [Burkholderia pseudomallei]
RHHLEFVLRGHGRLQHHAIKKQKPRTWRGFVSNLKARVPENTGLRADLVANQGGQPTPHEFAVKSIA